jgi:phenylalanyl-tRNA synthetase beta chain
MQIPLAWLASYVDTPPAGELLARLTALGHMLDAPLADSPAGPVASLEIRQNRPDCLSVLGIAREAAAAYAAPLREPAIAALPQPLPLGRAGAGPDRLCLLTLRGVRLGPLPDALLGRLAACGQRPVSPLVDLANYVMLELGQPLHVYAGGRADVATMHVRPGVAGERLELIDGSTAALGPDDLLVADARGPLALAGVMGGRASAVEGEPATVVVEAGTFRPHLVRRTARRHGLRSEAALRSSKLLPAALAAAALGRFLALLAEHGAAGAAELHCSHPAPAPAQPIRLIHADIARVGGLELAPAEAAAILGRLGFEVTLEDGGAALAAAPPPWRSDVAGPADLIEEVLRVAGYERIAPAALPALAPAAPEPSAWEQEEGLRGLLGAWGYDEVILDSFLLDPPPALADRPDLLRVANPPAGSDALRPALLPNMVGAARYLPLLGPRRRLYEIGHTFRSLGGRPDERRAAAWLQLSPERPADSGAASYYALKAEALAALASLGTPVAAEAPDDLPFPFLRGRGVRLLDAAGAEIGVVGALDQRAYGLTPAQSAVGAEILLPAPAAGPIWPGQPRRAAERLDLSYSLGPGVSTAGLAAAIRAALGEGLIELRLIDAYGEPGAPASATFRAVYAAERGGPREVWEAVRAAVEASTSARARG